MLVGINLLSELSTSSIDIYQALPVSLPWFPIFFAPLLMFFRYLFSYSDDPLGPRLLSSCLSVESVSLIVVGPSLWLFVVPISG